MGNKTDKVSNNAANVENIPRTPVPPPPPISQSSFTFFLKCIHQLPFTLSEEQFESIIYDLKEQSYPPGSFILKEAQPPVGVFVIIEGTCNVLANDGVTVINVLKPEDLFGEISCFYNKPCTCSIVCDSLSECKVIVLKAEFVKHLLQKQCPAPMMNWFISRKYLDTAQLFSPGVIAKQIIKDSLEQIPIFYDWSDEAVSLLCESKSATNIELYPSGTNIFSIYDDDDCGYLLLKGCVELYNKDVSAVFSASETAIWFGDEPLFHPCSRVMSAKAITPCYVVKYRTNTLLQVTEEFAIEAAKLMDISNRWKHYVGMREIIPKLEWSILDVTYVSIIMKEMNVFCDADFGFLYYVALGMKVHCIEKDDKLVLQTERKHIITLLRGSAQLFMHEQLVTGLKEGDDYVIHASDKRCHVIALNKLIIGIISMSAIENVKNIYPEIILNIE